MNRYMIGSEDLLALSMEVIEDQGGNISFTASGRSMEPSVIDGDVITVEPLGHEPLKRGDLLFHRSPEGVAVVHRMLSAEHDSVVMTCDASPWSRYIVPRADILGRISFIRRGDIGVPLGNRSSTILVNRLLFIPRRLRRFLFQVPRSLLVALKSAGPARRVLSSILKPIVSYRMIPWEDQRLSQGGENPAWDVFQARVAGRILGSAQLLRYPPGHALCHHVWLFSMHVRRSFQGLGIGTALTGMVIGRAESSDHRDLCLAVMKDNHVARGMYGKCGFEELEEDGETGAMRVKLGNEVLFMIYRFHRQAQ